MSAGIVVRKCEELGQFHACVDLQKEIWGEQDLEVEPATMFVVAAHTGGQVLGAFAGPKLVGYTLAVAGVRNGAPFLHSHMTGVLEQYRDQGVGRMLKLFQREEALGRGIRLIEWTFDPLEPRNAHFNLNRLGAICRRILPNLYGITTSPLHRGLATDRLVAEWALDSPRVLAIGRDEGADAVPEGPMIELPAGVETWGLQAPDRLKTLQDRIRGEFQDWFGRGYAAISLKTAGSGVAYQLAPWSDF
jgi:predicted GNAT superfamily acetyltransferase